MGHVDQHSQAVHLRHHFAAKFGQPFVTTLRQRIGKTEFVGIVPGQGQQADAQSMEIPQVGQVPFQDAAFLDGQERRDFTLGLICR